MRESDQASILYGAVRLADGQDSWWNNAHYNFDRQFVTYALAALVRAAAPQRDLVDLTNTIGFAVFWGGLACLLSRMRVRRVAHAAALVAALTSPVLWLLSPYFSSAFVSAGLLFVAWSLWHRQARSTAVTSLACLATFCAVGARADAVLVLPALAWSLAPVQPVGRWILRPDTLLVAANGTAALVWGSWAYQGPGLVFHAPFFYPNLFAGYAVFGLGAAGLVLIGACAALLGLARRRLRRGRSAAAFYVVGAATLLTPIAYYLPQMFSPRYWVPTLVTLIGLLTSRRAAAVLGAREPAPIALGTVSLIACLLPLGVGLRLPFPDRPALTFSTPTLYPTPDGLLPMGGVMAYFHKLASDPHRIIDHNQATWLAALSVRYLPDASTTVPILPVSLRSYLQLAAALQGLTPRLANDQDTHFYTDRRDLLRINLTPDRFRPATRLQEAAALSVKPVGEEFAGHQIVLARRGVPPRPEWSREVSLARLFRGNTSNDRGAVFAPESVPLTADDFGRTLVLHDEARFSLEVRSATNVRRIDSARHDDFHAVVLHGSDWIDADVVITQGRARWAISVHPDYMAVDRIR